MFFQRSLLAARSLPTQNFFLITACYQIIKAVFINYCSSSNLKNEIQKLASWGSYHEMNDKENELFSNTMTLVGVKYTPLCVATQLVSGTNYSYLCEATVVYPDAKPYNALVKIYVPLKGDATITEIKTVELI